MELDGNVPFGPVQDKWDKHKMDGLGVSTARCAS